MHTQHTLHYIYLLISENEIFNSPAVSAEYDGFGTVTR